MIIIDTNVVSELMRPIPTTKVTGWLRDVPRPEISITAITAAEILRGIRRLPRGDRRRGLQKRFDEFLDLGFRSRVLPFDLPAAEAYASIVDDRSRQGRPISTLDAMIAAIAVVAEADIATRDVGGFEGCGVRVVNPWL
jgi:predicted nucleic acid-binding protein